MTERRAHISKLNPQETPWKAKVTPPVLNSTTAERFTPITQESSSTAQGSLSRANTFPSNSEQSIPRSLVKRNTFPSKTETPNKGNDNLNQKQSSYISFPKQYALNIQASSTENK